jgi:hypothetical protein
VVDVDGAAGGNIRDDGAVGRVDAGEGAGVGRELERPSMKAWSRMVSARA